MAEAMTNEYRHLTLDEETWWLYIKKLTAHAKDCLDDRFMRGEWGGPPPGGVEAVDIVMEAIEDVCSGKRAWDPEQYPNLLNHLFWIVRSKVSNLSTSAENKSEQRYDEATTPEVAASGPAVSTASEDRDFIQKAKERVNDEKPLLDVIEAVECGFTKRSDIAQVLGISAEEMTNRRRRLQRRLKPIVPLTGRKPS